MGGYFSIHGQYKNYCKCIYALCSSLNWKGDPRFSAILRSITSRCQELLASKPSLSYLSLTCNCRLQKFQRFNALPNKSPLNKHFSPSFPVSSFSERETSARPKKPMASSRATTSLPTPPSSTTSPSSANFLVPSNPLQPFDPTSTPPSSTCTINSTTSTNP